MMSDEFCFSFIIHRFLFYLIVRSFFRDDDIVNMAFAQARRCDANESRAFVQLRDSATAAISHA